MEVGSKTHPCVENRVNVVILVKSVFTIDNRPFSFRGNIFFCCPHNYCQKVLCSTLGLFFSINSFHKHLTSMKQSVSRLMTIAHITDLNMYPSVIITEWTNDTHWAVLPSTLCCKHAHSCTDRYTRIALSTVPIRNYYLHTEDTIAASAICVRNCTFSHPVNHNKLITIVYKMLLNKWTES
jgi:hypothetical protein